MPLSYEELAKLHSDAQVMLKRKLQKIPLVAFPAGRKPTMSDIYTDCHTDALYNDSFPLECQIGALFKNYNAFAEADFAARKTEPEVANTLTIWLWGMDPYHSFSVRSTTSRWNLLLAFLTMNGPERDNMSDTTYEFLFEFTNAWRRTANPEEW
jgi:hypothetical protein